MSASKSTDTFITALLAALILAILIYSINGTRKDFQEMLIAGHIIKSMKPIASAKKIVDSNIKSGILDQCHGIQKIHSDVIEFYCIRSQLIAHIALPDKKEKFILHLAKDDRTSEWKCTSSLKARYIPLACLAHDN